MGLGMCFRHIDMNPSVSVVLLTHELLVARYMSLETMAQRS